MPPIFLALSFFSVAATAAEVDQQAAVAALEKPQAVLIGIDTRETFADSALPDTRHLSLEDVTTKVPEVAPDKNTPIVLYAASARRSSIAQDSLTALGYRQVINGGSYYGLKKAPQQDEAQN